MEVLYDKWFIAVTGYEEMQIPHPLIVKSVSQQCVSTWAL